MFKFATRARKDQESIIVCKPSPADCLEDVVGGPSWIAIHRLDVYPLDWLAGPDVKATLLAEVLDQVLL